MRIEVRCCCNPVKLVGWIDIDAENKSYISIAVYPETDTISILMDADLNISMPRQIDLRMEMYKPEDGSEPYLALKAEDIPIETLRKIPGFIEAR